MAVWKLLPIFLAEHRLLFVKRNLRPPEGQSLPPNVLLRMPDVKPVTAEQGHYEPSLLETEENPTHLQGIGRNRIAFPCWAQTSDLRQIYHCGWRDIPNFQIEQE